MNENTKKSNKMTNIGPYLNLYQFKRCNIKSVKWFQVENREKQVYVRFCGRCPMIKLYAPLNYDDKTQKFGLCITDHDAY